MIGGCSKHFEAMPCQARWKSEQFDEHHRGGATCTKGSGSRGLVRVCKKVAEPCCFWLLSTGAHGGEGVDNPFASASCS